MHLRPTHALLLCFLVGCDEPPPAETEAAPLSPELRAQGLERARSLETAGRPEQEAWERAIAELRASTEQVCPPEALIVPREEHFVAIRSERFQSDVRADILPIVLGRYGRLFPELDQARRIRMFVERDEGPYLREALAEVTQPREARAVVVFAIDELRQAQRVGPDSFESGRLMGRAYLLVPPDLHVACSETIEVTNGELISADRIGDVSMFESRALFELFERAEREASSRFTPVEVPSANEGSH